MVTAFWMLVNEPPDELQFRTKLALHFWEMALVAAWQVGWNRKRPFGAHDENTSSALARVYRHRALIGWGALILQLYLLLRVTIVDGRGVSGGIVAYLGFFTILTNILAAVTLSTPLGVPDLSLGRSSRALA